MRICICGGGNLGHVCAGFLANRGHQVSILTTKPERWSQTIGVVAPDGSFKGKLAQVSSHPDEVIPQAEIVLVCLPGFAIHDELTKIKPYLSKTCRVGTVVSSTGFFFEAFEVLPTDIPLFGFQRVPFISRIIEYGRKAELKGYKESLHVALEQTEDKESVRVILEQLFEKPVTLADSFYEVSLLTAILSFIPPAFIPCGRTGSRASSILATHSSMLNGPSKLQPYSCRWTKNYSNC